MNCAGHCTCLANVFQMKWPVTRPIVSRLNAAMKVPTSYRTATSVPVRVISLPAIHRAYFHTGRTCQQEARTVIRHMRAKESGMKQGGLFMLAIPVITFGLGTWQVRRRKWKLALIEDMEARTRAAPVPFPSDLQELEDLEYRKVAVKGHFDHSQELYIRPRSPVEGSFESGRTRDGRVPTGAYVVTPFILADSGLKILVNRGWVPREKVKPDRRKEGQVEGEISLVGVVRRGEKRPYLAAENDIARNVWMHRDVEAMSEYLEAAPVFLDADIKSTAPGGPVGGQTKVTLHNDHLQYLLTWYTLCAITTFMWYKRYWARR